MMSNVNLRPIQHSAVNYGRFGLLRGALAVLLAGVLFVVSSAGFVYASLSSQFANRVVNIDDYASDEQNKATPDSFEGRAVNILVVGTDSRNGASGELGAGDADDVPGLRNDSTMVIHISADRSRVQIISIPRDTLVDIPACKHRDGTTSEPTTDDMFNNAMVYGANGGDDPQDIAPGIACVRSTVEKLSGMSIDAFMVVDFAGFINMIDALGGVWFNIPERIEDDSAQLYIDEGCWKLSGTHALAYMRSRKGQGDGSDISRIGRQQQLISAMLRELQDKNYVTDPGSLINFLQAAISAVNVSANLGNASSDATLLINVLDLAEAHIAALDVLAEGRQPDHHTYNVGTGLGTSVREIVDGLRRVMGWEFPVEELDRRAGDPPKLIGDPLSIGVDLGWKANNGVEEILTSAWEGWQAGPRPITIPGA